MWYKNGIFKIDNFLNFSLKDEMSFHLQFPSDENDSSEKEDLYERCNTSN